MNSERSRVAASAVALGLLAFVADLVAGVPFQNSRRKRIAGQKSSFEGLDGWLSSSLAPLDSGPFLMEFGLV